MTTTQLTSLEQLTTWFGWMSLINIMLLLVTTFAVISFREVIIAIHGRMFNLTESELSKVYFGYLATFKIAIIVLNIVPYFALKIMS